MDRKKNIIITFLVVLSIMVISFGVVSQTVIASNESSDRTKVITSIEIVKGDTLWDIAGKYYTEEYDNVTEYVEEIKRCNRLDSDLIYEGQSLLVPYFTTVY